MEDIPGYAIQQDGPSAFYRVPQFAENLASTSTPLLTHTLRKRVSVPYEYPSSPTDPEKLAKQSSSPNSKRFKVFPKQLSPDGQPSSPESESSLRPVFHHFLSSMSNFAFNALSPSPESLPQQLDGKENNDYTEGRKKRTCEGEGHKGKDTNDRPFRCDQCGQSYKYGSAFARHREQDHRARPPAEKPFGCDACGMRFRYLKSFKKHRLNHTLDRLRSKNYASNTDATNPGDEGLAPSWKMEEIVEMEEGGTTVCISPPETDNGEEEERNDEERIEEGAAENDVESEQQWIVPWQNGSEPNPSPAENPEPSSPSESKSPSAATQDSTVWEQVRTPSSTNSSSNPPNSLETEVEEEVYVPKERSYLDCPFCRKGFRSRENLRLHVRKHTGERPFECSVCGRAFGGKSDMTRHLRIHTGERPYRCDVCSKRFARADYLSKHLTTHLH